MSRAIKRKTGARNWRFQRKGQAGKLHVERGFKMFSRRDV